MLWLQQAINHPISAEEGMGYFSSTRYFLDGGGCFRCGEYYITIPVNVNFVSNRGRCPIPPEARFMLHTPNCFASACFGEAIFS